MSINTLCSEDNRKLINYTNFLVNCLLPFMPLMLNITKIIDVIFFLLLGALKLKYSPTRFIWSILYTLKHN